MTDYRIGCAGWTVRKEHADLFPTGDSHLARYAECFRAVEINSSFYRSHRTATYARWAATVPSDFMFAVKVPGEVTHKRRLVETSEVLINFLSEVEGLENKLGVLLLQLPPSLGFDREIAVRFFETLRSRFSGNVVCEPRHETWFTVGASRLLQTFQVGRVIADPTVVPLLDDVSGVSDTVYYRLHGSPRIYYSSYTDDDIAALVKKLRGHAEGRTAWCIFDNTAFGAATVNALAVQKQLMAEEETTGD
ncbi:MAG: DUF72 domain-containing protein [Planctomycetaceae bacterium]